MILCHLILCLGFQRIISHLWSFVILIRDSLSFNLIWCYSTNYFNCLNCKSMDDHLLHNFPNKNEVWKLFFFNSFYTLLVFIWRLTTMLICQFNVHHNMKNINWNTYFVGEMSIHKISIVLYRGGFKGPRGDLSIPMFKIFL